MIINRRAFMAAILISPLALFAVVRGAVAASAEEIDTKVDGALAQFSEKVPGGDEFLTKAKGVLVFPTITKAGLGIGGEYGTGALRIPLS
jgi:lipid-binding SYLF domain-containing protein